MNPVRLIKMEKRMKQIDKEILELYEKKPDAKGHRETMILYGLIQNLIAQKTKLMVLITGKIAVESFDVFLLKQAELRRRKEKPPSPELEAMMKYETSPERVAERTKEFEDHRNEKYEETYE